MRKNKIYANCIVCGEEFLQIDSRHLCCCRKCREKYKNLKKGKRICKYCGKEYISEYNTEFCSGTCKEKYKVEKSKSNKKICEYCGKEFNGRSYQRFCCDSCKNKYFYENSKVTTICYNCGKEFLISKYELSDKNFCCHNCVMEWEYSNNLINPRISSIHKKVMDYLNNINITYEYEKLIGPYRADICINNEIIFEVQGTYWHADPRFYCDDELEDRQIYCRKKDKQRKEYLENLGYNVVYLWQYEIENNFDECINIINECLERLNEKTVSSETDAIV